MKGDDIFGDIETPKTNQDSNSPTLDETLFWLASKIQAKAISSRKWEVSDMQIVEIFTYYDTNFQRCELSYKYHYEKWCYYKNFTNNKAIDSNVHVKIQLKLLDASRMFIEENDYFAKYNDNIPEYVLTIPCMYDSYSVYYAEKIEKYNLKSNSDSDELESVEEDNEPMNSLVLSFKSKEMAERISKAFLFAIEQCAGKVDNKEPW